MFICWPQCQISQRQKTLNISVNTNKKLSLIYLERERFPKLFFYNTTNCIKLLPEITWPISFVTRYGHICYWELLTIFICRIYYDFKTWHFSILFALQILSWLLDYWSRKSEFPMIVWPNYTSFFRI